MRLPPGVRRRVTALRLRPRRALAAALAVLVLGAAAAWYTRGDDVAIRVTEAAVPISDDDGSFTLDTSLYVPETATAREPAPAILLAHGFGGSKNDADVRAREFAGRGYVVQTWSARGFGRSGGRIHLNDPDHEVRDAQRLIDALGTRAEVRRDAAGDPRVGVAGGSYGGALALNLAGVDPRVDAIAPQITYNDLGRAFLPEASGRPVAAGVFKRAWAGVFFGSGGGSPVNLGIDLGNARPATGDPSCGRFAADICAAYLEIATTGRASEANAELFRRRSPVAVLNRIKAPTLLVQGVADTLFPLSEADANARGIAATGTPVRVAWFSGGHDGGEGPPSDVDRTKFLTIQWFDHYLRGEGEAPATSFTYSVVTGIDANRRGPATTGFSTTTYPGLSVPGATVAVTGRAAQVANPPNGTPAALTSLPGVGFLGGAADVAGQHAVFTSTPLQGAMTVVGSPALSVRAASATGEAVLFVKLYDVAPSGVAALPYGQVAPVRLTGLPRDIAAAQPVRVALPAIAHEFAAGHRLQVVVATSDQGYAGPVQPAVYTVDAAGDVVLPATVSAPLPTAAGILRWIVAGLLCLLLLGIIAAVVVARLRARRRRAPAQPDLIDVPLRVSGLRKVYDDGYVAVDDVSFTVERDQVVGLLGPNGAGKTTTLRVLLGLVRATAGEVLIFGHRLAPGAPVLARLGALVEGPGFLPHLSGRANLERYWQATGRPAAAARFDDVLAIADLGTAIERPVRAYSHGMRQRLAIAQAMLGMPDLLLLDEPTDGLDPPQIAALRDVLRRYATGGRAVLVSSHLLAEVERTCTHVVVVHKGRMVASGPVDAIVGESASFYCEVSTVDGAIAVLDSVPGVLSAVPDGRGLVVELDGTGRAAAVAALVAAGIDVDRVVPRRRLEDAFLALVSR